jgi:thioredoxin 1
MSEQRIFEFETRNEFINFVQKKKVVVVKFTAEWCNPCKKCKDVVDECFSHMPNHVCMVVVDIDKSPDIKRYLKCTSVPTLINFVNGEMMDSIVGAGTNGIVSFFRKTAARATS